MILVAPTRKLKVHSVNSGSVSQVASESLTRFLFNGLRRVKVITMHYARILFRSNLRLSDFSIVGRIA